MAEGGPLINLGNLAQPAVTLIDKVSEAVGGIAKPGQIRRVAKAEADADIIKAEARIKITELEERALARLVREEGQRQENIENITAKALPNLNEDAKPEDVEKDFLTHFFDRCRLISDEEMQQLWANLLAGEANEPGTFSKKTIELVSTLDKSDAQLFTIFCTFVWNLDEPQPLVYDINILESDDVPTLSFIELSHLSDLGLVTMDQTGYVSPKISGPFLMNYYSRPVMIDFSKSREFDLGYLALTRAGVELFTQCGPNASEKYFTNTLLVWFDKYYAPSCPIDAKDKYTTKFL